MSSSTYNIDKLFFINKLLTNKYFFLHFMLYINCFCSYLCRSGMQIQISTQVCNRYALFSQFVLNQVHTISSCAQHLFLQPVTKSRLQNFMLYWPKQRQISRKRALIATRLVVLDHQRRNSITEWTLVNKYYRTYITER